MGVHEVAERGFGSVAETYERVRPGYPDEALAWFSEHLGLGPGALVADVAAGTGKFTRALVTTGARVVAVEPVAAMRDVLHRELPDVAVVAGTAETLPFTDGAFDAVTVAQAFHWLDPQAAPLEIARVLRPRARMGVVWNARGHDAEWIDAVWEITDRVEKAAPWRDHDAWTPDTVPPLPGFGRTDSTSFHHRQPSTPQDVVDRVASTSHVAALPDAERSAVLDEVRELLATHPETAGRDELAIPYRTDVLMYERVSAP